MVVGLSSTRPRSGVVSGSSLSDRYLGMRFTFQIMAIFLFLPVFFSYAENDVRISYELNSQQKWKRDVTTEAPAAGNEHFVLTTDESIDLLFSFNDEDFFALIDKEGAQKLATQILTGKNVVQKFVSDESVQMKAVKISHSAERKILSFETDYKFGEVQYHSIEKYFIYKGKALHAVLRWNEKSNSAQLKSAKSDFEKMTVKIDGKRK